MGSEPTRLQESLPKLSNYKPQENMPFRQSYGGYVDGAALWRDSGVPARHRDKTLDRHDAAGPWAETYRRVRDELRGKLIVLLGKRGTGKTQMAVDWMADACHTLMSVRYLKAMDLFREIRSCYRQGGPDEVKVVDRLCSYGVLVIDEAHERSDSEWENRTLTNIIDRRYDAMKTTILISNMSKEAFAAAVGASIVSRVHESGEAIVCDWESFRVAPHQPQTS